MHIGESGLRVEEAPGHGADVVEAGSHHRRVEPQRRQGRQDIAKKIALLTHRTIARRNREDTNTRPRTGCHLLHCSALGAPVRVICRRGTMQRVAPAANSANRNLVGGAWRKRESAVVEDGSVIPGLLGRLWRPSVARSTWSKGRTGRTATTLIARAAASWRTGRDAHSAVAVECPVA